jgi:type I restriction-modification system DNA methylase subunit
MQWLAASEKDADNQMLEKRLWEVADQLRANSGLNPQQYSGRVLGLIFLRYAKVRFAKRRAELEKEASTGRIVHLNSKIQSLRRTRDLLPRLLSEQINLKHN